MNFGKLKWINISDVIRRCEEDCLSIYKNGSIFCMKKIIDPSKYTFVYGLTDGECHKELTGTCSLDKKPGRGKGGESGVAYCQRLYKSLIRNKQFYPIFILKGSCGHFEFSDGQHRTCIAQRKGLELEADIEDVPQLCRICEPPKKRESSEDYDDVIIIDVSDLPTQLLENQPKPRVVKGFKFLRGKTKRKTNRNNKKL